MGTHTDPRSNIHPTARIAETARIYGPVTIGPDVVVKDFAVIGDHAESLYAPTDWDTPVFIGSGSVLRECVVVQRGVQGGSGTFIGRDCYVMHGCHVAHDVTLEDEVKLAPYVVLGGHSEVHLGGYLGIHAATHPHVVVGAYAMVGMQAAAIEHVRPGTTVAGVPAKTIGRNTVGLDRAGLAPNGPEMLHFASRFEAAVRQTSDRRERISRLR